MEHFSVKLSDTTGKTIIETQVAFHPEATVGNIRGPKTKHELLSALQTLTHNDTNPPSMNGQMHLNIALSAIDSTNASVKPSLMSILKSTYPNLEIQTTRLSS